MSLRELYQEMIIDHGKQPRNAGKLENPSHQHDGFNPLCGDKLTVYVNECEGVITDARFEGVGCAISVASASLMTEAIKGKKRVECEQLFERFHQLVTQGEAHDESLGKLAVFSGVAEFPARVKCASLAWHTLKAALGNDPHPVSTEE
jgi:nitrogen fixation protein NifU and related proteins